jgi:hypothetical protein
MHRIMAAKTTRTQNTAILWHIVAENCNTCDFSPGTELGNFQIHLHMNVMYVCTHACMYKEHNPPGQWTFTYLVKQSLFYLCIRDKCNQGLKVKIFKCLNWMTYFNGFLPAHDEPLTDLTSFNIIHYTQPNEMGRTWNLRSYTGLHLMAADAVATTIQSALFSPDTFVYWLPLLNYVYSHQYNSLYPNCSNLQHSETFLWQIPTNRLSILEYL